MLKVRIIPSMLWKNYGLVKGISFDSWRRIGTIIPAIKVYNMRQVDELIIVDIMASKEEREPDYETVNDFSAECFMPLTVGGGIRKVEHIKNLLRAGADKVSINSTCYQNPEIISEGARLFGSQCIVASIDATKHGHLEYECFSHSGTRPTGIEVGEWAKKVEKLGAGEILITSIDRDGTMQGFDIDLIRKVSHSVSIPVIASGGAGNYEHIYQAIIQGDVQAVSVASIYHFTEQTPLETKRYLSERGVNIRKVISQ